MLKGSKITEETRIKMKIAKSGENHPLYGKHHSKETKDKIRNHCIGRKNSKWVEIGSISKSHGYKWIKVAEHKWIVEHRFIVEQYIERELTSEEIVHHIDGNKENNELNNLYLCINKEFHTSLETMIRYNYIHRFSVKSNLDEIKSQYTGLK